MLKRKAYKQLERWKNSYNKKALCIIGARQTGKTTLVRKFAKENYPFFIELNFLTDPKCKEIFANRLNADYIITNLSAYVQKKMEPHKTLILLDEIQECPEARTAIKFLVEDGRFDYIETGSLLGVKNNEVKSYPVGYEEILKMYPLDFEEYLWANGVQEDTIQYLRDCFEQLNPVSQSVHDTLMTLFYSYIVVGGMPDIVQTYVDTHDISQVITKQREIIELYRLDITKYANRSNKIKIRSIFDSIPSQLNEKNRRFFLNKIEKSARQNRYYNSFEWLSEVGVALPCYNINEPIPPLQLNEKHSLFKLFMGDTGLLCAACMENIQFDLLQGRLHINMGSILENVMAQSIKSHNFSLHYFDSKKYGELDFVIQKGMNIDLIEIKSGEDYKKHNSLDKVLKVKEWNFENVYVFCKGNIEKSNQILYLPWYMIMFYEQNKVMDMIFEIDLSRLNQNIMNK